MLIVGQQAIAIVTVAMIEVVDQALQISGVVMFKQRDAEGFLRAKVVVEGALGHLRRLQKFAQAHSGKTAMHAKLLAGGRICSRVSQSLCLFMLHTVVDRLV